MASQTIQVVSRRLMGNCCRHMVLAQSAHHHARACSTVASARHTPSLLTYTHALVRGLSADFAANAVRQEQPEEPIDQALAVAQHAAYVDALRKAVPHVVELPPLDGHPDCVFVEDTTVAVGSTVLITSMGHPDRRGEEDSVADALASLRSSSTPDEHDGQSPANDTATATADRLRVLRASELVPGARVDGGDVLFTGSHIFVGLSSRTNAAGVEALSLAFPDIPVEGVSVDGALHLKSLVTLCAPNTLAVSQCRHGTAAAATICDIGKRYGTSFSVVLLPSAALANVVLANGVLFHRAESEHPGGAAAFSDLCGVRERVELKASEVEKADGALTCCSILLHLP